MSDEVLKRILKEHGSFSNYLKSLGDFKETEDDTYWHMVCDEIAKEKLEAGRKQGVVEELEKELKWIEVQQEHYEVNPYNKEGYKLCDEAREEVLDLLSERKEQLIKELKGLKE